MDFNILIFDNIGAKAKLLSMGGRKKAGREDEVKRSRGVEGRLCKKTGRDTDGSKRDILLFHKGSNKFGRHGKSLPGKVCLETFPRIP